MVVTIYCCAGSELFFFFFGRPRFSGRTRWILHDGVAKADGKEVSIFRFDKEAHRASPAALEAAANALRRAKTVRHPCCLAFIDGLENEQSVVVVTERVRPLGA